MAFYNQKEKEEKNEQEMEENIFMPHCGSGVHTGYAFRHTCVQYDKRPGRDIKIRKAGTQNS